MEGTGRGVPVFGGCPFGDSSGGPGGAESTCAGNAPRGHRPGCRSARQKRGAREGCDSVPGGVGGRERRGPPPTSPGLGRRRRRERCSRGEKGGEAGRAKMAAAAAAAAAAEQQSSNGPVKKSMREKAVERRNINKEHNSNFKAGYIPIDEDRLHKTGLRGRKGNLAICVIILLFILAVINLIITLVIWAVIRIGPNGCDSMEFHESGLLRFKQVSDMGVIHPLYKSTVGGRRNENLVITGNNQPIVFQQGTTKLSVEKNKTSITSDIGMQFFDPRTQNILFSTDYETHEFHLPSGVKSLNVQKASTERITSNATSDLNIKVDGRAIVRGNEGVFIMGKTIEFHMGGNMELKAENSIILNGTVMVSPTRLPSSSSGDQFGPGDWVRYKLCVCADGTLFKVQVTGQNMGCQISDNPCGNTH
ncbi:beta-sarcoglycan [Manis javanica]|uniref:beta-sarcoglycan n=1 Tax=Manis javanica TaxID=9974 RepID=UPI00187B0151|nr:beta-sarcoglycan [Manis javanica]